MSLALSETPKTYFVATRPIYEPVHKVSVLIPLAIREGLVTSLCIYSDIIGQLKQIISA